VSLLRAHPHSTKEETHFRERNRAAGVLLLGSPERWREKRKKDTTREASGAFDGASAESPGSCLAPGKGHHHPGS
ncbi:hypothetical protein KUCAC02_035086, partial [Chaenocephalus aceratus]